MATIISIRVNYIFKIDMFCFPSAQHNINIQNQEGTVNVHSLELELM